MESLIGAFIQIIEINSSVQKKKVYKGEINFVDTKGKLYGTWGDFTINPEQDKFEIIQQHK